jgi:hypothetical protein
MYGGHKVNIAWQMAGIPISVVLGIIVGLIITLLMNTYTREGSLSSGAATLGFAIGFLVLVLPQLAIGVFLLWKGGREADTAEKANKQRELLNIVKSRGQVDIGDLAIEMQMNRDEIQDMIHQLVGMGLYSGYINWDEGTLYSQQASKLRELTNCLNCGGELELAGKGVIQCPYCGTEYFLG